MSQAGPRISRSRAPAGASSHPGKREAAARASMALQRGRARVSASRQEKPIWKNRLGRPGARAAAARPDFGEGTSGQVRIVGGEFSRAKEPCRAQKPQSNLRPTDGPEPRKRRCSNILSPRYPKKRPISTRALDPVRRHRGLRGLEALSRAGCRSALFSSERRRRGPCGIIQKNIESFQDCLEGRARELVRRDATKLGPYRHDERITIHYLRRTRPSARRAVRRSASASAARGGMELPSARVIVLEEVATAHPEPGPEFVRWKPASWRHGALRFCPVYGAAGQSLEQTIVENITGISSLGQWVKSKTNRSGFPAPSCRSHRCGGLFGGGGARGVRPLVCRGEAA